nr:MAG TPA: Oligo alginate lyase [Caudoviricetes sp.]
MSTTLTLTANKSAAISRTSGGTATSYNDHTSATVDLSWNLTRADIHYLLVGFPEVAEAYMYRPILNAYVKAYISCSYTGSNTGYTKRASVGPIKANWDPATVTSHDIPALTASAFGNVSAGFSGVFSFLTFSGAPVKQALLYGCAIYSQSQALWYMSVGSSRHSSPPQLVVTFDDDNIKPSLVTPSPANGARLDKATALNFSTRFALSEVTTLKNLTAVSGNFEYRVKGASTSTVHRVTPGAENSFSFTVPANTFAAGDYEYRFIATDNLGQTTSTAWSAFTTRDTIPVATPLSPDSSLEDGTQAITFRWMHSNESGSAQTKAELQKSADGSAWTTLGTVTGAANEYAAPAGTFTSGTWYWRVRTYNLDGVAGEWSDALSFVVVAGPTKPVIVVKDASPRPLINWQTSEQSAYQLQLDDIIDVTEYGSEKTWRCPVYLDDGAHTFRVRSQNSYGLWSEWGSATFTVSHTASGAVVLTVDADHRAELSWSYAGSWTEFVVYRDGVAIAKTTDYSYTDDYSVGTVRYQVRVCASDGTYNYSLSNEVTVSVMPETVMLSALGSGKWLFLRLSTAQHRTNTIKASRAFSLTHLSGRKFPEAELTEFCDRSISVSYATDDEAEKAALEALMGSPVCLKTPGGKMVIGILDTLSETESMFYSSYSFAVSQMHYPEEVDLDA